MTHIVAAAMLEAIKSITYQPYPRRRVDANFFFFLFTFPGKARRNIWLHFIFQQPSALYAPQS